MLQSHRYRNTPVLLKGSTYNGWVANALAAPSACWDGTQFVMTCSAWQTSLSKWASLFFTSPNLIDWSYVEDSLLTPTGDDYILGNGGLAWFDSKYYFAYNHYPPGQPTTIALVTSTDLLNWTLVGDPIIPLDGEDVLGQADPTLTVNPSTGKLELWYVNTGNRHTSYADSIDGVTWTKYGSTHLQSDWNIADYGEPHPFYFGSGRHLTFDASSTNNRRRMIGMAWSQNSDTSWTSYGTILAAAPFNTWENTQVFDSNVVGLFDLNDKGPQLWMLYAGGDVIETTDRTNSSIGLAYIQVSDKL